MMIESACYPAPRVVHQSLLIVLRELKIQEVMLFCAGQSG